MSTPEALPPEVMERIKGVFFQDCDDLLAELETNLLALQGGERDPEVINTVFRAVHSIKGGAGSFGLDDLVAFSHAFESVMADIRSGKLAIEGEVMPLLLRAADVLADHVKVARHGGSLNAALARQVVEALGKYAKPQEDDASLDELDIDALTAGTTEVTACWKIRIRPHKELYTKANETLALLRELRRLGEMTVELNDDDIPLLQDLDPEQAYLSWTVTLHTASDETAIREIFEFVERDCDVDIEAPKAAAPAAPAQLEPAAHAQSSAEVVPGAPKPALSTVQETGSEAGATDHAKTNETIRVDVERIDRLVNLVGELVINQAMLAQHMLASGIAVSQVDVALEDLDHLTRDIQDSVMSMRAQPVKSMFQRMSRLVREVEAATGKQVSLVTAGSSTEVDRTVIERLTDPLTHIVRNAIDHGIETPEQRLAKGKPAQGTLRISAAHRSGRVVIEIADDGQGIDRDRVRKIAIERGLIQADAVLTESDVDHLIFQPGFSTASQVSALSGRGVGMDVVKRGVHALGGRITITSLPGEGTTVTLSLPLTLAVLDGMTVSVCGQSFVAPLTTLLETVQPKAGDVSLLGASAKVMRFRGGYIPLIDLGILFAYRTEPLEPTQGVALIVEDDVGARAALLVEDILGQRQVVIKSVQANYRAVPGIAAATILGDGRVALILDANAIIELQRQSAQLTDERRRATG